MESKHCVVVDHRDDGQDIFKIIIRQFCVAEGQFGDFEYLFKCKHGDLSAHTPAGLGREEGPDFSEQ